MLAKNSAPGVALASSRLRPGRSSWEGFSWNFITLPAGAGGGGEGRAGEGGKGGGGGEQDELGVGNARRAAESACAVLGKLPGRPRAAQRGSPASQAALCIAALLQLTDSVRCRQRATRCHAMPAMPRLPPGSNLLPCHAPPCAAMPCHAAPCHAMPCPPCRGASPEDGWT